MLGPLANGAFPPGCLCAYKPNLKDEFDGLSKKEEFADGNGDHIDPTLYPSNYRVWTFGLSDIPVGGLVSGGEDFCHEGAGHTTCTSLIQYYDSSSTMVDPAGNKTEIIYDTSTHGTYMPESYWVGPHNTPLFGTAKEERYYEGDGSSANLVKQVSRTWMARDGDSCNDAEWASLEAEDLIYPDDHPIPAQPATHILTTYEDWNGYGNHETVRISGNGIGNSERITRPDYVINNKDAGGTPCPAAMALQAAWLPNVVANKSVSEQPKGGIETLRRLTEFAFNTSTGRVTDAVARAVPAMSGSCKQSIGDLAPGLSDVAMHIDYDVAGNVSHKGIGYGGTESFGTDYEYQYGVERRTKNSALSYWDLIRTIDPSTNVVLQERFDATGDGDPTALVRKIDYDELGRPISETVGGEEPSSTYYNNVLIPNETRMRLESVRTVRGTDDALIESVEHYDNSGRINKIEKVNTDGTRSYQYRRFNPQGLVGFVSEWTTNPTESQNIQGTSTDYTNAVTGRQDPFGRPHKVTSSFGGETDFEYFGLNTRRTVLGVKGLSANGSDRTMAVTTTTYTDGLGRLRAVDTDADGTLANDLDGTDQSGEPSADAVYDYEITGEMKKVNLVHQVHFSPTFSPTAEDRYATTNLDEQARTMVYDNLGRLASEADPEKGLTRYLLYDSLGQAVQVEDERGRKDGYTSWTTYDVAGRPTKVERVRTAGSALGIIRSYTFDADVADWAPAGASEWHRAAAGSDNCLSSMSWKGSGALRYGTANCTYGTAVAGGDDAMGTTSPMTVNAETFIHFMYLRQVRKTTLALDETWLEVQDVDSGLSRRVFYLNATDDSWDAWRSSGKLRLAEFFDFATGATRRIKLVFHFRTGDTPSANANLGHGLFIDNLVIADSARTTLQTLAYDENHCSSGSAEPCQAVPGNEVSRPLGKLTTETGYGQAVSFDGGTLADLPFTWRRHAYQGRSGRESASEFNIDWRGTGVQETFYDQRGYDSVGNQTSLRYPRHASGGARTFDTAITHGHLTGLTDEQGRTYVASAAYDEADALTTVVLGNGVKERFSYDGERRPLQIWTEGGLGGTFNTGTYTYDGGGNVTGIGANQYRYDAAGRLIKTVQQKKDTTGSANQYVLRHHYDPFGNLWQQARTDSLPALDGFVFDRMFGLKSGAPCHNDNDPLCIVTNRITTAGFVYDLNGNLTTEPQHDNLPGAVYHFDEQSRMGSTWMVDGTTPVGRYGYDGTGARIFRELTGAGGDGQIVLYLRDGSGHVLSEYRPSPANTDPSLGKEYIYAGAQLVAENGNCYFPPYLGLGFPFRSGGMLHFLKQDTTTPVPGTHYLMHVRSPGTNQQKVIDLGAAPFGTHVHDSNPPLEVFSWPETDFYTNNLVTIEAQAECGSTGYSNEVSFARSSGGGGGSCVRSVAVDRGGENQVSTDGGIRITWDAALCPTGTLFRVSWTQDSDAGPIDILSGPTSATSFVIEDQSATAGLTDYSVIEKLPGQSQWGSGGIVTPLHAEGTHPAMLGRSDASEALTLELTYTPPLPVSVTTRFFNWDHLGSTRMITDQAGAVLARMDFFPFGQEVPDLGLSDVSHRFTGHERDPESKLDYVYARYYGQSSPRFLSPDPLLNSGRPWKPQTWNRYQYALNNPLNIVDPTGLYDLENVCWPSDQKCNKKFKLHAKDLKEGLARLEKKTAKVKDPVQKARLEAALKTLGTEGDHNGVTVHFGKTIGGGGGETIPVFDQATGKETYNVTLDPGLLSVSDAYARAGAHEGTHVGDIQSGIASPTGQPELSDFSFEYRGYQTSAWAAQAQGHPELSFKGIQIWNSSWAAADRQALQDKGITRLVIKEHPETTPHNPWPN